MEKTGVSAIVEYDYTAKESDELTLKKGAIITNIKIQPGGWWEGTLVTTGRTGMFPDNFVRVLEPDDKNPVVLRDKTAAQNRRCKVIYSYRENKADELSLSVGDVIEIFEEVEEGWWRGKLNGRVGVFPSNFVELIESASPTSANRKSSTNSSSAIGMMASAAAVSNNLSAAAAAAGSNLSKTNSLNKSRTSLHSSREDLVDHGGSGFHHQQQQQNHDAPSLPPKPVRELCKVLFAYAPANDDELKLVEGDIITIISKELPDKGWWKGELRGRVGVFPDNFVVVLPPEISPVKEPSFQPKPDRPPPGSKHIPGKQNSTSVRKESFGSRDSLNDTTPAGGTAAVPITGAPPNSTSIVGGGGVNVAAHRKSLETRNAEPPAMSTSPSMAATATEKPPRKLFEGKTSEIRKSLENLDESANARKSTGSSTGITGATPPPVLGKKPQVPIKKSPSITSVTNNLFSGLKQKVGGGGKENKAVPPSAADSADGICGSKQQHVTDERLEFGHGVERGSVLKDMRANRAKAPKRRPPTSAGSLMITAVDSSQQSNSGHGNGNSNGLSNGNAGLFQQLSHHQHHQMEVAPDSPKPDILLNNHHEVTTTGGGGTTGPVATAAATGEEFAIAKPRTREWEKHKVPWMDELKANQAKKTSPAVASAAAASLGSPEHHHHSAGSEDSPKPISVAASGRVRLNERASTTAGAHELLQVNNHHTNANSTSSSNSIDLITTGVSALGRKDPAPTANSLIMTKSLSALSSSSTSSSMTSSTMTTTAATTTTTKIAIPPAAGVTASTAAAAAAGSESSPPSNGGSRPVNVHLRSNNHRSISPTPHTRNSTNNNTKTIHITTNLDAGASVADSAAGGGIIVTQDNVCSRVTDLEQKVTAMERQLGSQAALIEDLRRALRDESDKVRTLQKELEKYAQCVTQV